MVKHIAVEPPRDAVKDVFISYSRRDMAFARRLVDQLTDLGLDSWVDWAGIPFSAAWLEEIRSGIDEAQNFVFLITPDSLRSRVCHLEIEYARQTQKRIIPIFRRELDLQALDDFWNSVEWGATARSNYQTLNRYNYIFFRKRIEPEFNCRYDDITGLVVNPDCDGPKSDAPS